MSRTSYREQADQILQESLANIARNPLPPTHRFAMNPANQQFLNCAKPYKKIPLLGKFGWKELVLDDDDYDYVKGKPTSSLFMHYLAAILAFAFVIGSAWWILNTFNLNSLLARDGVVTEAKVVDKYTRDTSHRTSTGSTRHDTDYYITFELAYTNSKGQPQVYKKTESVSSGLYNQHKVGGPLQVIYYPNDPSKLFISGSETASELGTNLLLALAVVPVCLVTGIYQLGRFARQSGKRRRLKKGQFLSGTITNCEVKQNLFGKPGFVTLSYCFTTPAGQPFTGQASFPARYFKGRWHLLEVNKPLTVLYQHERAYEVL